MAREDGEGALDGHDASVPVRTRDVGRPVPDVGWVDLEVHPDGHCLTRPQAVVLVRHSASLAALGRRLRRDAVERHFLKPARVENQRRLGERSMADPRPQFEHVAAADSLGRVETQRRSAVSCRRGARPLAKDVRER